ncbi:ATP/GTP-binding protein [Propionicicella superfundia]|uniref:ATP/GTP-binding protein n=1 Tax=Propionicicella superfundia TaxID=348582 RepID=UPI0004120D6A|nr:ATP/GTP-binding protein [Propionicicella superfundia]
MTGRTKPRPPERAGGHRPPARGWWGRGGGQSKVLDGPVLARGTTVQVCGLWPWVVGAGTPRAGVPLGRHLDTGATVCADPISWFRDARLIANPSLFILGLPGLGKSTVSRRMVVGLAGYGVVPMVLGDTKPDYVDAIRAIEGQVIELGPGRGSLNVLDPGESSGAAALLRDAGHPTEAAQVEADAHSRRRVIVSALIAILRKAPVSAIEESILGQALYVLDARHPGVPVLTDLLQVIRDAPDRVREVAVDRGSRQRYDEITEALEAALLSLVRGGRLGDMFSRPTSEPMRRDRPVVYDISGLPEGEQDQRAAALLACWSNGFATVNVAHTLADVGLEPRRHYLTVMDELWQALRSGPAMVDRTDALTRLNRTIGTGTIFITHTMADLASLATEEDRMKARGFIERAGMVICGGLPAHEMPMLTQVVPMSRREETLLASWATPPGWKSDRDTPPPGMGKFLVKVGGRAGIPLQVELTATEAGIHDTSHRWHEAER